MSHKLVMDMDKKLFRDCSGHEMEGDAEKPNSRIISQQIWHSYCLNCIQEVLTTALRVVRRTLRFWRKFHSLHMYVHALFCEWYELQY